MSGSRGCGFRSSRNRRHESGGLMNLLIFPQYAYPVNHVVVNTVYEELLPSRGHTVHMIRPMADITRPQSAEPSWTGGGLVGYPEPRPGNAVAHLRPAGCRAHWRREAVARLDELPLDAAVGRNDLPSALAAIRVAR